LPLLLLAQLKALSPAAGRQRGGLLDFRLHANIEASAKCGFILVQKLHGDAVMSRERMHTHDRCSSACACIIHAGAKRLRCPLSGALRQDWNLEAVL
jgi:hypothetical protein